MAHGKFQMRRIENPVHRQVTFCKRRMGLFKKAKELSVLCDADIGVIVFSPHGKIYELATNRNMQSLIERYKGSNTEAQGESSDQNKPQMQIISREIEMLKNKEGILKAANDMLQERIIEQSGILGTSSNMMIPQLPFQRTMESDDYYF